MSNPVGADATRVDSPVIGLVIAAYNAADTLGSALDSVLRQRYERWQVVVVDDGSTDATLDVARDYAERDGRITVLSQANAGAAAARNAGIAALDADFIGYLDADDRLADSYMEAMLELMRDHPDRDIYSSDGLFVFDDGSTALVFDYGTSVEATVEDLIEECWILSGGALVRAEALRELGGFREHLYGEDYDLWLRAMASGLTHVATPAPLYIYHRCVKGQKSEDADAGGRSAIEALTDLIGSGLLTADQQKQARTRIADIEAYPVRSRRARALRVAAERVLGERLASAAKQAGLRVLALARPHAHARAGTAPAPATTPPTATAAAPGSAPTPPKAPLVSVVIPAFAAEEFIEFTMRSVHAQAHRPIELIVVDDCATDRTGEIAQRVASELRAPDFAVRVERHEVNRGGAAALHTGFSLATGDFVCWLSADDAYISPAKTTNQLAVFSAGPGIDLVYDRRFSTGPSPEQATVAIPHWARPFLDGLYLRRPDYRLLALLLFNPMNGSSVMMRRHALERFGTFDMALGNVDQDGDLWLRYSALGMGFGQADQVGVFYRIHPGQTTHLTQKVERGCAITRIRMLVALAQTGRLRALFDHSWPALAFATRGHFVVFPLVTQALCEMGLASGCGFVPRTMLRVLRSEMKRRRYWDDAAYESLVAEARDSVHSEEFERFLERLSSR